MLSRLPAKVSFTPESIRVKYNRGTSYNSKLRHTAHLLGTVAKHGSMEPDVVMMAKQIVIGRNFGGRFAQEEFERNAGNGLRSRGIRRQALNIVSNVPPHQQGAEILAIGAWVADNIRYTADPHLVEYFQLPSRTLRDRAGDCDDMVSLACALASSIGYPTAALIVNAQGAKRYNHVMWGVRPYTLSRDVYIPIELTKGSANMNPGSLGTATKYLVVKVK